MRPVIRCSSLDRQILCPASRLMSEIVAERDSDSPLEGIYGHWLVAGQLIEKLGASPPVGGLPAPEVPEGYVWDGSADWIANYCFREVKNLIPSDWSLEVEVPLAYGFDFPAPIELAVVEWIDGKPVLQKKELCEGFILSGHIDALAVSADGKHAIGFDWKFGYCPVDPAEMNRQVLGYIGLIKLAYPGVERIDFYVVQPRNDDESGFERVSTVTCIGDDCDACVDLIGNDVMKSLINETLINSGLNQCKYCPVGIQCPVAQIELNRMKMTLTPALLAQLRAEPDDATLGDAVVTAKTFENAVDAAKEMLHERLDKHQSVVSKGGTRITRKITGGKYSPKDAPLILSNLLAIAPPHKVAHSLTFSTGRMKVLIAEEMNVPQTSKAGQSAQAIFDQRFRPLFEQAKTRTLIFS